MISGAGAARKVTVMDTLGDGSPFNTTIVSHCLYGPESWEYEAGLGSDVAKAMQVHERNMGKRRKTRH